MANPRPVFQLKRSRLAVVFQLSVLGVLLILLYSLLSPWLWLGCVTLAVISYVIFLKSPDAVCLEYLDGDEWSLQYAAPKQVLRLSLHQVVDHQIYIVLYFAGSRTQPLLIWRDQLSLSQWKALKRLALLF